jgi:hypothetical protein
VVKVQFGKIASRDDGFFKDLMSLEAPEQDYDKPSKQRVCEDFLASGIVHVALIMSAPGVVVPEHLGNTGIGVLTFSYAYGLVDFEVDGEGLRASLLFSGRKVFCDIPWSAVVNLSSKDQRLSVNFVEEFPNVLN